MSQRWKQRPDGSNWGMFGHDDQYGRMNLITPERRLAAFREVREGRAFCLSLSLDLPGGNAIKAFCHPPALHPIIKDGKTVFNMPLQLGDPKLTDVSSDDAVLLYNQYSTHWDALAHRGMMFDADGDGVEEAVFYNNHPIVDEKTGEGTQGALGATSLGVDKLAETCVQGRGVMLDLFHHFGTERVVVGYDQLMRVIEQDKVQVEIGDILCVCTGMTKLVVDARGNPDASIRDTCAVLDGWDERLLQWIDDSGISAIASDNLAIEAPYRPHNDAGAQKRGPRGPALPLHERCIVKLGIHLGEFWYLTELADWLRAHERTSFLLTAPPLRLPGAAGAATTPVATV